MSEVKAVNTAVDAELVAGSPQIKRFLAKHSADEQEAADVYQESITRVLEQARDTSIQNPVAYAIRVARNLLSHRTPFSLGEEQELPCHRPSPEERADQTQQVERLTRFINSMPRLRREVFIRRRLHGESRAAIARSLGVSEESVKKHMTRALADFQRFVDQQGAS